MLLEWSVRNKNSGFSKDQALLFWERFYFCIYFTYRCCYIFDVWDTYLCLFIRLFVCLATYLFDNNLSPALQNLSLASNSNKTHFCHKLLRTRFRFDFTYEAMFGHFVCLAEWVRVRVHFMMDGLQRKWIYKNCTGASDKE